MKWADKFRMDEEYVDNITFLGDAKLVVKSFLTAFKKEGISAEGQTTVAYFTGNEED